MPPPELWGAEMTGTTGQIATLLDRLRAGDRGARDALIAVSVDRFHNLASGMLSGFPSVQRWEETNDVLQNALIRLCRALDAGTPKSPRHFCNLAALQIRRELLTLSERYKGPHGLGANHHTSSTGGALAGLADRAEGPSSLAEWGDYHRAVEALPSEAKEVFGLLWYDGLTQEEAAELLEVSVRTVKRRWLDARLALAQKFGGELPGK